MGTPLQTQAPLPDAVLAAMVGGLERRDFLRLAALAAGTASGIVGLARGAIAGPFTLGADDFPIPADKKFDPAWMASLTARGQPMTYTAAAAELEYLGMPIGGICCGQVYLGGDGSLWHWDIFNLPQSSDWSHSSGPLYAKPSRRTSPLEQGFAVRTRLADGTERIRTLNASGFRDIEFKGQYPIGLVRYSDPDAPIRVELEAFSPFCPLDEELSGTPCTLLHYTLHNTSTAAVEVSIAGWLENKVCAHRPQDHVGVRHTHIVREQHGAINALTVECAARARRADDPAAAPRRPDLPLVDFEKGTYEGWEVTGTAFGTKPRNLADIAKYQGDLRAQGQWLLNSHETRGGEDVVQGDRHTGTLLGPVFAIERSYLCFRIGGGRHPGQTCINLLIDGAVVRTATGHDSNVMRVDHFDVREFEGKKARLQIVDGWTGAWGNIGFDDAVQSDEPSKEPYDLLNAVDHGTMSLSVLESSGSTFGCAALPEGPRAGACFAPMHEPVSVHESPLSKPGPVGCVGVTQRIEPGQAVTVSFVIAWHFANINRGQLSFLTDSSTFKRWYATGFANAGAVRSRAISNLTQLTQITRQWRDTWYDSTLPYWLLDRTFATISTAATATCWRFDNGRFYGWEGTYCCPGTCTHVWQYAHGLARIFPGLERSTRELVDFGLAFREESGQIDYRAEAARELAVDGQCGTILRAYREHQMCKDDGFLRSIWPRVRKAVELMLSRDTDQDGILDGPQYNTLDTTWYGQIAWLTSMYLAAVKAGGAMARDMGDATFADRCDQIARRGSDQMVSRLFNGEYFIHLPDAAHPEANSTGTGCHIDQLLGQSWAHQVGLGRIVAAAPARKALESLYRYSVAPDIGPYRSRADAIIKGGRWYAMPGEGGLLMCTWPKGGAESAAGKGGDAWAAGYFNECMSGFEHQVASHMLFEGLVEEGLVVTRLIHDRYHAKLRNPYNEIECSNHYARAMASYGTFLAACGFEHHGPRGILGFAPRLTPDAFACAFTAAGCWGRFSQQRTAQEQTCEVEVRWGQLALSQLHLEAAADQKWSGVSAVVDGAGVGCSLVQSGSRLTISFEPAIVVAQGSTLSVAIN
jgi:uncharacterized protein (DUF608 family)